MRENYKNIPEDLKKLKRWCLWDYEVELDKNNEPVMDKNGNPKIKKPPLDIHRIKIDCTTHAGFTFKEVSDAEKLGFIMRKEDGLVGIDLDKCIREDGSIPDEIREIINRFNSYTEISPSGKGIRIFVYGTLLRDSKSKNGNFEIYSHNRYLTVTGNILSGSNTKIIHNQEAIDWFIDNYINRNRATSDSKVDNLQNKADLDKNKPHNDIFLDLFSGNWQKYYKSQSEADLGLCSLLYSRYLDYPEEIDAAVKLSALYREKWDREEYKRETINKAMNVRKSTKKYLLPFPLFKIKYNQPVEYLIEPWLEKGSLNMLYGMDGVGKTTFMIYLAKCLLEGKPLFEWKTKTTGKILYIIGEGSKAKFIEYVDRFSIKSINFFIRYVIDDNLAVINKQTKNTFHDEIIEQCEREKIDLVIFDNLSSLCTGINENESEDWSPINSFFLKLCQQTTVIFLHHSGKTGSQRGTSMRSANCSTVIKLEESNKSVKCHFDKKRCDPDKVKDIYFVIETNNLRIAEKQSSSESKKAKKLTKIKQIIDYYLENPNAKQVDIANKFGTDKSNVSKIIKKYKKDNNII